MRIEVLGAGGAWGVPRPFCPCPVCEEARLKGAPYTRLGPSLFLHEIKTLIDTPEEIGIQLNRARITRVDAVFYSHWHPDHTAGIRVWEANYNQGMKNPLHFPPKTIPTQVYLPENVARTFGEFHALWDKCEYQQKLGVTEVHTIPMGESVMLQQVKVTPIQLVEDYAAGFLFEWSDSDIPKRVLILMDEVFAWTPPPDLGPLDALFMPAGAFELNPLSGERKIAADHPILTREATFPQILQALRGVDAKQVVFIHLNEIDGLTFDDYLELARRLNADPSLELPPVRFAYDTLIVEI